MLAIAMRTVRGPLHPTLLLSFLIYRPEGFSVTGKNRNEGGGACEPKINHILEAARPTPS